MARRQSTSRRVRIFAASAAIALLAASHAGAASASSNTPVMSDDAADGTLDIPASELTRRIVSHEIDAEGIKKPGPAEESEALSATHYLAPRVAAVLRKVFKDTEIPIAESSADINTGVPGVSDNQLARYRRQMYRTDI